MSKIKISTNEPYEASNELVQKIFDQHNTTAKQRVNIKFDGGYNAHKSGGLFFGIRIHFPCTLCNENIPIITWRNITLSVGLFLYTINIRINYAYKHN